jgi:hypothetical protein
MAHGLAMQATVSEAPAAARSSVFACIALGGPEIIVVQNNGRR